MIVHNIAILCNDVDHNILDLFSEIAVHTDFAHGKSVVGQKFNDDAFALQGGGEEKKERWRRG